MRGVVPLVAAILGLVPAAADASDPASGSAPGSDQGSASASAAAAWRRGDHQAARPLLRRLALEGDPAAMTLLGVMAARGLDGPRRPAVAAAWYMRAAREDHAPALLALADAFRRGEGVVRDEAMAGALEARARRLEVAAGVRVRR